MLLLNIKYDIIIEINNDIGFYRRFLLWHSLDVLNVEKRFLIRQQPVRIVEHPLRAKKYRCILKEKNLSLGQAIQVLSLLMASPLVPLEMVPILM